MRTDQGLVYVKPLFRHHVPETQHARDTPTRDYYESVRHVIPQNDCAKVPTRLQAEDYTHVQGAGPHIPSSESNDLLCQQVNWPSLLLLILP